MMAPEHILITPTSKRWSIDYEKESHLTNEFRTSGMRWASWEDDKKLKVGDLFGAYDDGKLRIHRIESVHTDLLANHVRPWWRLNEYKVRVVVYLSERLYTMNFSDYCSKNGYKNHSPVGRKVLKWT